MTDEQMDKLAEKYRDQSAAVDIAALVAEIRRLRAELYCSQCGRPRRASGPYGGCRCPRVVPGFV